MRRTRPEVNPARHEDRRSGTILVIAMIALLIAAMIGASLVKTSVASLRQLHRQQQQMQTGCLADAGCQRAVMRLRTDPDYKGEEWNVPAEQLQSKFTGCVRITIGQDPQSAGRQIITVVAEYPQNEVQQTRITRQLAVARPAQEAK